MKRLVASCALLLAGAASAQTMEGVGRIALHAGWRYTPNGFFARSAEANGTPVEASSPGGPQFTGTFGYAATANLELTIDLFAGVDTLKLQNAADVTQVSYGAMVGVRAFRPFGSVVPNIGIGVGPLLAYSAGGPGGAAERIVTAYAAMGGLTWRLTDTLGITFDVRYLVARGFVSGIGGVNAGGLWGGAGVVFLFPAEPQRSGAIR